MKIRDSLILGLLGIAIIYCSCQIKPADPGVAALNLSPTTFLPNVPPDSSKSNPYKMRLQWHGNDADGIIVGYEFKIDGPIHKEPAYRLFKNNWIYTENHFGDFKFQNGWYRLWVRSVDEKGAKDETPDSLTFHVTGPTFDRGILLVDDDATGTREDNDSDRNKDTAYANLLREAGFSNFTVWDHEAMFGLTGKPVFVDSAIDSTGNKYYGMSAYSTIIWYTGHDGKDHIYKLEKQFIDYLEMGGNLWISGIQPLFSITGSQPTGVRFSESSFARKYLHIQSADSVENEVDLLLSVADFYPDLKTSVDVSTSLTVFAGHYNWTIGSTSDSLSAFNQLIPEPDADALYLFSKNVYESVQLGETHYINSEEFANTPCAVRFLGANYKAITFGFPLIRVERRKDVFDHATMVEITRQILASEFLERP
jgi:hypothetical protein